MAEALTSRLKKNKNEKKQLYSIKLKYQDHTLLRLKDHISSIWLQQTAKSAQNIKKKKKKSSAKPTRSGSPWPLPLLPEYLQANAAAISLSLTSIFTRSRSPPKNHSNSSRSARSSRNQSWDLAALASDHQQYLQIKAKIQETDLDRR